MVRTPCCRAESGIKKGAWTPEEDQKLVSYLKRHGEGGWRTLPEKAGLKRCGKSCRLRWANYLRPDIKRGEFTENEQLSIISLHALYGNKWSAIARGLPGRTDNEIKNYWNTHIKKSLIKKGIDPITHKGTDQSENLPETPAKQTIKGDNETNKKSGLSSARFLNRVASRFGKIINKSVMSEIIASGSSLTTTTTSVSVDSELDKSKSSTPVSSIFDVECNLTPTLSSSTFSDYSVNDPSTYCRNFVGNSEEDTIGFSSFLSDEDFMMLEESCVEDTVFINELTRFFQEDENDYYFG